jgi:hypothetical protein
MWRAISNWQLAISQTKTKIKTIYRKGRKGRKGRAKRLQLASSSWPRTKDLSHKFAASCFGLALAECSPETATETE